MSPAGRESNHEEKKYFKNIAHPAAHSIKALQHEEHEEQFLAHALDEDEEYEEDGNEQSHSHLETYHSFEIIPNKTHLSGRR
ncbi:unnamed protein product [Oikopleura dioica]|uniref:Uncharacterized protein n=1 Tax=Oikopleura dioica TaxID=34765 RepID=E4Y031_OIKDI|nr:unnamed protein product [Oikopleura dioica]